MSTPVDLLFVLSLVLPPLVVVLAAGITLGASAIEGRARTTDRRHAPRGAAPLQPVGR